jgi:hypothetical protein
MGVVALRKWGIFGLHLAEETQGGFGMLKVGELQCRVMWEGVR